MRKLGLFGLLALVLTVAKGGVAEAQTQTTGAIQGLVSYQATGQPIVLATVVASSPAMQGDQTVFTDDTGRYEIANLPPGNYSLLFTYGKSEVKRENIEIGVGKVTPVNAKIDTTKIEKVTIIEKAPSIDVG